MTKEQNNKNIDIAENLGSGINTASNALKLVIFIFVALIVIALAIWLFGVLGTLEVIRERLHGFLGI